MRSPRYNADDMEETLRGTLKYIAPELADSAAPTPASDIWSFGITIAELVTGTLPWAHLPQTSTMAFLSRLANREIAPQVPDALLPNLAKVIKKCWEPSPAKRATATELLAMKYFLN
jgi:serine/threonine protein kinase